MFFCLGAMAITGLFYAIDDWRINWIIMVLTPAVIGMFLLWFWVYETPQFLLNKGIDQTLKVMNKIGYINERRNNILTEQDVENVQI